MDSPGYFTHLVHYIHDNPRKHGFVDDCREWQWSSYHSLSAAGAIDLAGGAVLAWFGGPARFAAFHRCPVDEPAMAALIDPDQG